MLISLSYLLKLEKSIPPLFRSSISFETIPKKNPTHISHVLVHVLCAMIAQDDIRFAAMDLGFEKQMG